MLQSGMAGNPGIDLVAVEWFLNFLHLKTSSSTQNVMEPNLYTHSSMKKAPACVASGGFLVL